MCEINTNWNWSKIKLSKLGERPFDKKTTYLYFLSILIWTNSMRYDVKLMITLNQIEIRQSDSNQLNLQIKIELFLINFELNEYY